MSEAHDAEHHHRHSLTFSTHENDFEKLTQFQTLFYCPELSVEISYHSVFVVNSRSLKSVAITARDSSHLFFLCLQWVEKKTSEQVKIRVDLCGSQSNVAKLLNESYDHLWKWKLCVSEHCTI